MEYIYDIMCKIDMDMFAQVKEVTAELNKHMSDFGFSEKLKVISTISIGTITTQKEASKDELALMLVSLQAKLSGDEKLKNIEITELKLRT